VIAALALAACGASSSSQPTNGNPYGPNGITSPSPQSSQSAAYWRNQGNLYAESYIGANEGDYTYQGQTSPAALCADALFPATHEETAPVSPLPATSGQVAQWNAGCEAALKEQAPPESSAWSVNCVVGWYVASNNQFIASQGAPVEPTTIDGYYATPSLVLEETNNSGQAQVSPGWTVTTSTGAVSDSPDWGAGVEVGADQTQDNPPAGSQGGNTAWLDGATSCTANGG
jgi:hypothetical protein